MRAIYLLSSFCIFSFFCLPEFANADEPDVGIFECFYDSDCSGNQECHWSACVDTEGIGESCSPLTPDPICREDLECRLDPADPLFQYRCFPQSLSQFQWTSDAACKRLYSASNHSDDGSYFETFWPGLDAVTYGTTNALSAGYSGFKEEGAVYAQNGEYGCYRTECTGGDSTVSAGFAITSTDFYHWDPELFEGSSHLIAGSAGWSEIVGFAYVVSESFSDFHPLGTSYAIEISLGIGVPFVNGAAYDCTTSLNLVIGPPIADAGDDIFKECTSPDGALVTLDGTSSYDPLGGTIQEYTWTGSFGTRYGPTPTIQFPISAEQVSLVVENDSGISSKPDTVVVTVEDTTGPDISLEAIPSVLWVPNNKMVNVQIAVEVEDTCDDSPYCEIESVVSNEQETKREVDWQINDDFSVELRAQRDGGGSGRVYEVTVGCEDFYGNRSTKNVEVLVPHDQSRKKN